MMISRMLQLLTTDKIGWDRLTKLEQKEFDVFAVNKMLATNSDYIELVNLMQLNYNLPKEHSYKLYQKMLPNSKVFIDFNKITVDKTNKNLLNILAKHYEVSTSEAKVYLFRMNNQEKNTLLSNLGYSDKEITKLLK